MDGTDVILYVHDYRVIFFINILWDVISHSDTGIDRIFICISTLIENKRGVLYILVDVLNGIVEDKTQVGISDTIERDIVVFVFVED